MTLFWLICQNTTICFQFPLISQDFMTRQITLVLSIFLVDYGGNKYFLCFYDEKQETTSANQLSAKLKQRIIDNQITSDN